MHALIDFRQLCYCCSTILITTGGSKLIWNPYYEAIDQDKLYTLQFLRLKQTLERVYQLVPFYRESFRQAGAKPGDIRSLDDLQKLPFTFKNDLRDNFPYGLFTVDLNEVVRIHSSSGTTGIPTVVGYTQKDLDTRADLMARTLTTSGATKESVVHIAYGYGLLPLASALITGQRKSGPR